MYEFIAPEPIRDRVFSRLSVFLAGTIDMGNSVNWQAEAAYKLTDQFNVFNPRRKDWNSSWQQKITNPQFKEQVDWELDGLDQADYILMYFLPGSQSPITLLELGLYAETGKLHVVCPEGFHRKGNVDIVCDRFGIPLYTNLDDAIEWLNNNRDECSELDRWL